MAVENNAYIITIIEGLLPGYSELSDQEFRDKIFRLTNSESQPMSTIENSIRISIEKIFASLVQSDDKSKIALYRALSLELHPDKIQTNQPRLAAILVALNPDSLGVPQQVLNTFKANDFESLLRNPAPAIVAFVMETLKKIMNLVKKFGEWFFPFNIIFGFVAIASFISTFVFTVVAVPLYFLVWFIAKDLVFGIPNTIMNGIRNFISNGHYYSIRKEIAKAELEITASDEEIENNIYLDFHIPLSRVLLFAKAMGRALSDWPESWAGRIFHGMFIKPIQLGVTPILLTVTFVFELIYIVVLSLLLVIPILLVPISFNIPFFYLLLAPVYAFDAVVYLCSKLKDCCFKKGEPPPPASGNTTPELLHSGSNASGLLSKSTQDSISDLLQNDKNANETPNADVNTYGRLFSPTCPAATAPEQPRSPSYTRSATPDDMD